MMITNSFLEIRNHTNHSLNRWTEHQTEEGYTYYFNFFTGESTYDRPIELQEEYLFIIIKNLLLNIDWILANNSCQPKEIGQSTRLKKEDRTGIILEPRSQCG